MLRWHNGRVAAILVIDNYDSFVYNIVQYLAQLGAEVEVWRNDDPRFAGDDWASGFDGVLLSPGPGHAREGRGVRRRGPPLRRAAADLRRLPRACSRWRVAYGGVVDRAPELLHGKTSAVFHERHGCVRRPAVTR